MTHDPCIAVSGADAVYTDVWLSMGDDEAQRARRRTLLEPYQVNEKLMRHAKPDALFMHCLPAQRGEEVDASTIDGPQSVVFEEAENRMHTAQALLIALLTCQLRGTSWRGETT